MLGLLEPVDDGMDNVVEYNHRRADTHTSVGSGGGGGGVDDILRRLGNVETGVSELRSEVSAISATLSHLATAASVSELRTEIAEVRTEIAGVRSEVKTEIAGVRIEVAGVRSQVAGIEAIIPHLATKADMASMEAAIIKWIIATTLSSAALAFTIAKFVH